MITTQYYTGATTLGAPSKPVEIKIPLWWNNGGYPNTTNTSAGGVSLADGGGFTASANVVHVLSTKWPTGTKFAFEATIIVANSSATGNVSLWDATTPGQVTASQISTTSTTATVVRSSQFTLTAGHQLEICAWTSSASYWVGISDASLIIFP